MRGGVDDLSFELHFSGDLAETAVVDRLQDVLRSTSPAFSADLRVLEYERDRRALAVDLDQPGSLRRAVVQKGSRRGPAFDQLSKENAPAFPRRFGNALLRGRARSTFLTVRFDAHRPGMRIGDKWLFSNGISGWVGTAHIDRRSRAEWVTEIATAVADHPDFLWGAAFHHDEFRARNLDEVGGLGALGRDMSRSLPGLYWLNLFGPPYVDLVGAETLRSSPAHRIEETGHATIVQTYRDPSGWSEDEGKARHAAVLAHLGPEYFFDRAAPEQTTRAPDFGLPPLPPRPPFQVFTTDGKHFTPIPPAAGGPPAAGPSDPRP